ncbi:hypothetical protein HK405_013470 [Cladochytrium tenue]|nr:hypothetical protein HK405_013470 [Cladochytrium tenue]
MALPYIDKELESSDAVRSYVDSLIQEELRAASGAELGVGAVDARLPPTDVADSLFQSNTFLLSELERVSTGGSTASGGGLDTTRFRLEPPRGGLSASLTAWDAAAANAAAQLEHQAARLTGLELARRFSGNAWRLHAFQLEWAVGRVREAAARQKEEMAALNKERKLAQLRTGATLQGLEARWGELVDQSLRVDIACQMLEVEIAQAEAAAAAAASSNPGEAMGGLAEATAV